MNHTHTHTGTIMTMYTNLNDRQSSHVVMIVMLIQCSFPLLLSHDDHLLIMKHLSILDTIQLSSVASHTVKPLPPISVI